MNLALIDPFQLAQDSPETQIADLRSGHATTIRFNRKGDYLAAGRADGKVVIWDMETFGVAMKLHGHWRQVQSLSWSRCGRYLLSSSQDCRAILWDLATQTRIRSTKFEAPIYTAELHPYNHLLFVVSLFEDHPYLVDVTNSIAVNHRIPTVPLGEDDIPETGPPQATTSAIFSTNGHHLITGTSKGYINIIETSTLQIIHSSKLATGLFSLLRLTSNGRQLLANCTDRIIRVINMPDLSQLRPSSSQKHEDDHNPDSPTLDPSTIYLSVEHKFQDLVNRLRWNHASISPTTSLSNNTSHTGTADYVTASTYMKRDIYIWELHTNSLLRILEAPEEPAIVEWHPSRPMVACTSIDTGTILLYSPPAQQKWSALAPDFTEVTENVEYIEREDEFDVYPAEEEVRRRVEREDEDVDVLTIASKAQQGASNMEHGVEGFETVEEESFVLPMLYNIEDSEDDQELVRMGVGTMRKKEVNEGKEYEVDGEEGGALVGGAAGGGAKNRKRK